MGARWRVMGVATLAVASFVPTVGHGESPWQTWNADPRFDVATYDSGPSSNRCFINAPWGSDSWGVEGSTFSDPLDHRLELSRFARRRTGQAFLSGRDSHGRWGFVRFVQGDIWSRSHCGAIPWHVPPALQTSGRELVLEVDYRRESGGLLTANDSWLMPAVNLWFSSPALPAGGDKVGRKPLVMDLAFGYSCNIPGCKLGSFEDEYGFHYQRLLDDQRYEDRARCAGRPTWRCYTVPLNGLIEDALRHDWSPSGPMDAALGSLSLYQLDVLIELYNSKGSASIDNVRLDYRDGD
jgi:hypothetical protein